MRVAFVALALSMGPIASIAFGQVTLTGSNQRCEADAHYEIGAASTGNISVFPPDLSGANYNHTEDRPYLSPSFAGHGYSMHGATFTPPSPLIGGSFSSVVLDACTSAEVTVSHIGPHTSERAYGLASGLIEFHLSAAMNWTWIGGWQGFTHNTNSLHRVTGVLGLSEINVGTQYVNQTMVSQNGVGDWMSNFSLGGVIGPGDFRLVWSHESIATGGNTPFGFFPTAQGGGPLISCIDSTFTLTPRPAPGAAAVLGMGGLVVMGRRRR